MRLKKDLTQETEERLRAELDRQLAIMNRRKKLGMTSDWQFGEYLSAESKASEIGDEIRRRYGRPLLRNS